MKWIIDRFEGEMAVLTNQNRVLLEAPRALLPKNAKEGDVLNIEVDASETKTRTKELQSKMNRLFH